VQSPIDPTTLLANGQAKTMRWKHAVENTVPELEAIPRWLQVDPKSQCCSRWHDTLDSASLTTFSTVGQLV
jgi:hypothetical protein